MLGVMGVLFVVVLNIKEGTKIISMLVIFIMVILTCILVVKAYPNEYFVSEGLQRNTVFYSPVGDASKLTEDIRGEEYPSVDGEEGSPRHMFMFARNQCSPKCIGKSPYTCDRGAVCITDKQVKLIGSRGKNADNC